MRGVFPSLGRQRQALGCLVQLITAARPKDVGSSHRCCCSALNNLCFKNVLLDTTATNMPFRCEDSMNAHTWPLKMQRNGGVFLPRLKALQGTSKACSFSCATVIFQGSDRSGLKRKIQQLLYVS